MSATLLAPACARCRAHCSSRAVLSRALAVGAVLRWYSLGVSLAALLPQPPGAPFVRAVLQLLEEYQHYVASSDRQFKITRARGHRLERGGMANDDDFSVSLQRSGGKVLYEYLLTPHAAHALSGVQVALSLCEVLAKIYQKLIEAAAHSGTLAIVEASISSPCPFRMFCARAPHAAHGHAAREVMNAMRACMLRARLTQAVMRVDERLEEHFVVPAVKHTEALAKNTLWQSLGRLDPLFARVSGQAASVSEDAPMERLADNNNFSGSL